MEMTKLYRFALLCMIGGVSASSLPAQPAGPLAAPGPDTAETQAAVAAAQTRPQEDWGVLRVDPASLMPLSATVIGQGDYDGFSRELLRVQWRIADPIDLYVVKPIGVKNPPVVLYLYNYTSDTDLFRNDGWCKRATQGGFAAVGFVSALAGQRYANRPMKEWFVSELQESLGTTVHDVQMVLNYLDKRGDLDMTRVGMFGQGSGGAIAALAAQADPRISVLDLLNPWGDWPDWLKSSPVVPDNERAAYLTPEFLKRVADLDPLLYLPTLKLKGLRVEQVMNEPMTPLAVKQKIAAAVPHPEQLVQYKDEAAERDAWRVSGLSGWIHDQLRPSQPSQSSGSSQAAAPTVAGPNASPAPRLQVVQ